MPTTWIVVADSSAARVFDAPSPTGGLSEVAAYAHSESRLHERDLRSDQPGTTKDRAGYATHGIEPRTSPKEHEAIVFARMLAETIERARATSQIERLLLVAPPEFLGHLRAAMSASARKIVASEFTLNVVRMAPDEIRRHLPEKLYSSLAK